MESLKTINIVEDHFGDELTEDLVAKIEGLPNEHFELLLEKLAAEHERWGASAENELDAGRECFEEDSLILFDPSFPVLARFLLYANHICVVDPLDPNLLRPDYVVHGFDSFEGHYHFVDRKRYWSDGLRRLAELRVLLKGVPETKVVSANLWDSGTKSLREELQELWATHDLQMDRHIIPADIYAQYADAAHRLAFALRAGLSFCGDEPEFQWFHRAVGANAHRPAAAPTNRKALSMLYRYDLPSADRATLVDLLSIRKNEESFHLFRTQFASVLAQTYDAFPELESQFQGYLPLNAREEIVREFGFRLGVQLKPVVEQLRSSVQTNALEKFFSPLLVSFSVSMAGYLINSDVPSKTLIASAGVGASTVLEIMRRNLPPSARRRKSLMRAYVSLMDAAKRPA